MGFLDNLKDSLSFAFGQKGAQSAIGIDIGSSSIKVVQLKKEKGKLFLETYGAISLGPYANTDSGKAVHVTAELVPEPLKDLIKEANITTLDSGMALPFAFAMVKLIKIPKLPKDKLAKMIPIEARKFIPMPLNEVVLNWTILPKLNTQVVNATDYKSSANGILGNKIVEYLDVLIVAIHKDAVATAQSIARQSELNVAFFELEAFASARASIEYSTSSSMLVDLGATTTKVYIIESGYLRFAHLINMGSQSITENIARANNWPFAKAERMKRELGIDVSLDDSVLSGQEFSAYKNASEIAVNRIFTDVNRVLINYEKKYSKPIANVVLSGGGANLKGVLEFAQNKLSLSVQKAKPFDKINAPAFLQDVLDEIGPEFAVSVGLAQRRLS